MQTVPQRVIAEAAGVSVMTVSKAIKRGNELYPARVGTRVDIEHPSAIKFIEDRLRHHTDSHFKPSPRRDMSGIELDQAVKEALEKRDRYRMDNLAKPLRDLSHLTLSQLVKEFGDDPRFEGWLKALKEIEAIDEKRIKNAELRSKLVSRRAVEVGFVAPYDQLSRQLLQDGAKNMAVKAAAMAQAGNDINEITEQLRAIITTYLKANQKNMLDSLDKLEKEIRDGRTS
jgi:hypothetical protein